MEQIMELFKIVDYKLLILIIISAYWVKKNFSDILVKFSLTHKILVSSTIISIVYYFILHTSGVITNENWVNYVITYFAATSFYELAFKPLEEYMTKKFGSKNILP